MAAQNPVKKYAYPLLGILVLLAVLILLPDFASLQHSIEIIFTASFTPVLLGIAAVFLTYVAAACTLMNLARKKIRFGKTFIVQLSSGFAGKLAPAGLGGFALNTRYLTRQKHTVVQAGAVMSINGMLGFFGHCIIFGLSFLAAQTQLDQIIHVEMPEWLPIVVIAAIIMIGASLLAINWVQKKLKRFLHDIVYLVKSYAANPTKIIYGFMGASAVTLLFAASLYLSAHAVGIVLNPFQVLLVYTACAIGIAITPTPGGLGGAEAAITGSLVALGIKTETAISIALLYRLISYWLPIIPGFILFQYSLKRNYI